MDRNPETSPPIAAGSPADARRSARKSAVALAHAVPPSGACQPARQRRDRSRYHAERAREIIRHHPELIALVGHRTATLAAIALVAGLQVTLAVAMQDWPWWAIVVGAYGPGAVIALAIWTLLHECTHDLVLRTSHANRWLGIVTGLPLIVPAASSFRICHLLHHRHQGDPAFDGDIASRWEIRLVGNSPIRKAIWLLLGAPMQALRPLRMRHVRIVDRWFVVNLALQVLFNAGLVILAGWQALAYCLFANIFALGLHPLGARWIQEHFMLAPGQETYSYYGPMNVLAFNAGYHVEHHDLMRVAWFHLPAIGRAAPEYYRGLQCYRSWTGLLVRFLCDRTIRLDRRWIREGMAGEG